MKELEFKRFGNYETPELELTSKTVGRCNRIVPLALTMEVKNGSDLYDNIMYFSKFNRFKEYELNRVYEGAEDTDYTKKLLQQLKDDCNGANVKITIKIELEKYE